MGPPLLEHGLPTRPCRAARFSAVAVGSLAGAGADAQSRAEGGVHAHAEGRRAVRVLGAELAAGEAAVVDAHLVGAAAEARAQAPAGLAAGESAVLPADGAASAFTVGGTGRPDAVAHGSRPVVEARVPGGTVRPARALDARATGPGRRRTLGGVGDEPGRGGVIAALDVVPGDA